MPLLLDRKADPSIANRVRLMSGVYDHSSVRVSARVRVTVRVRVRVRVSVRLGMGLG